VGLAGGHVVAREAPRTRTGLAAMVLVGLSTVMEPAVVWYSAGQALWAGLGILGMLAALQAWRESGGAGMLAIGAVGAVVAAGFWSGGYAAGPVGLIYLWTDGRSRCRRAAAVPMLAVAVAGLAALALRSRGSAPEHCAGRTLGWYYASPQVGAVVVAAGWWMASLPRSVPTSSLAPVTRRGVCGLAVLVGALLVLQVPRAERLFATRAGLTTMTSEVTTAPL